MSSFYIGDPYERLSVLITIDDALHIGWLRDAGKQDIAVYFDCRVNGYPVALYNGFDRGESLLRTWHVIWRSTLADSMLPLLACLFPRVCKSRIFQFATHW